MIRSATLEDISKLCDLKFRVGKDTYYEMGTDEQFVNWSADVCSSDYFEQLIVNNTTILVAEYKSEFLGMAAITFHVDHAFFSNLYVGLQKRGIGSLLTEHRMSLAKNYISLQAPFSTYELRARCFYRNVPAYLHLVKHGFQPYDYQMINHYNFPAIMMKQDISVPELDRPHSW